VPCGPLLWGQIQNTIEKITKIGATFALSMGSWANLSNGNARPFILLDRIVVWIQEYSHGWGRPMIWIFFLFWVGVSCEGGLCLRGKKFQK
jgi:hypothetical protein